MWEWGFAGFIGTPDNVDHKHLFKELVTYMHPSCNFINHMLHLAIISIPPSSPPWGEQSCKAWWTITFMISFLSIFRDCFLLCLIGCSSSVSFTDLYSIAVVSDTSSRKLGQTSQVDDTVLHIAFGSDTSHKFQVPRLPILLISDYEVVQLGFKIP